MKRISTGLGMAAFGLLAPQSVLAHHAMGGELPATALQSAISGVAHPIVGIDHLAFVVLVGLLAARSAHKLALTGGFALATAAGCLLTLAGIVLPVAEVVIGASVVALGLLLLRRDLPETNVLLAAIPVIGLFHGWAYGQSIIGAETGLIPAYIAGFGLVQFAIAAAVAYAASALRDAVDVATARERLAAAVCMGIGCAILIETVEGMVFTV